MNSQVNIQTVALRFNFRRYQLAAHRTETRFVVNVWHRRAGKTFYVVAKMLKRALEAELPRSAPPWRGYYIAPTYRQAKAIAWDYLRKFAAGIPGVRANESELRIDLPNGPRLQLLGAESYDTLRGRYADDVVLDETALIPGAAWTQVIAPMLADRKGRATFIGTPAGRQNLFFRMWEAAGDGDRDWSRSMLRWQDTGALDQSEIDMLRRTMSPEEFAQEMECSWNAALRGAYYAREMTELEQQGRITTIRYERSLPVVAALDLGWSDAMVVGFWQQAGTEQRCLLARAYEHSSIADMVHDWRSLPFPVETVVLPHDARVTDLGSGKTRQQTFHDLGCSTVICPNQKIHEGISAVRDLLAHTWFDDAGTQMLREALVAYRSEFDEVRQVHKVTPLHDWSSHWADMVRYYALGRPDRAWSNSGPRPEFRGMV